ncbi:MAG: S41 family peptidase [Fusobacterium perfoetens]|uniref:S41 family peptidase n=1 Tax=Fusobacterium perfoetens TaxID=852 RepID=UPI0023F1A355|nr:S41 family peptidase [Fusobacterium perfoetens]MCI6152992.1 S41 family peptidase [Fusobacterium perfoetens]MDY3237389.1 S41 family peptidase [Fusobacterium perfoetens]
MLKNKLKKLLIILSITSISTNILANEEKIGFMNNIKQLKEISDVMDIIQENFVGDKKIDKTILMQGALKGMIDSLEDPHSNYFSKKGMEDLEGKMKGEYSGVGMIIRKGANEPVTVELLIEGSPAFNAGIRPNDKILYIEDKSTYDIELEEASRLLKGKSGTKVKLKLYRESEKKEREITLTRADIKLENVRSKMLDGNVGYIKLTQFAEDVDLEVKRELEKLLSQGMEGLILDLRNNPGGIIGQAIKISSMFIEEGVIVSERPKKGKEIFSYREGKYYGDFPLVILINEGSASASEIVSGAIRDYKRGLLIGEKSFGKGSVQVVLPLPDEDGIKLTIAKYYTPKGENIHGKGINPDIVVEEDEDYLFYDGFITNVNDKDQEASKEKLLTSVVGKEKAEKLIKKEDKQLKTAEAAVISMIKERKNKK